VRTPKADIAEFPNEPSAIKKRVNPFIKLMKDQERIAKAIENNQPLSSLKDIKFVRPI